MKLNLGCGEDYREGWLNVDRDVQVTRADYYGDLDAVRANPLPYPDHSVDYILCSQVIEHLRNPLQLSQELYRLATPECIWEIVCPHGASDDAWEDQTHVRAYYPTSFLSFSQPYYHRAPPGFPYSADWEPQEIRVYVRMSEKEKTAYDAGVLLPDVLQYRLHHERNHVAVMTAFMKPVTPGRPRKAELMRSVQCLIYPVES